MGSHWISPSQTPLSDGYSRGVELARTGETLVTQVFEQRSLRVVEQLQVGDGCSWVHTTYDAQNASAKPCTADVLDPRTL